MSIRLAVSDDVNSVKKCAESAYQIYTQRIGKKPAPMVAKFSELIERHVLYVFELAGSIVGFVVFYPRSDHMHLENIAVSPGCQGKGIGCQLIEYVELQSRSNGFAAVELYTNEKMAENLVWYPSVGYQEIERRKEDGFNRVYFRKKL